MKNLSQLDQVRIRAATYTHPPTISSALFTWLLCSIFINALLIGVLHYIAFLITSFGASAAFGKNLFHSTHTIPQWTQHAMYWGLHAPLCVLIARRLFKYPLEVTNERASKHLQYTLLTATLAALPKQIHWSITSPNSAYHTHSLEKELLGTYSTPRTPLDAVGTWSIFAHIQNTPPHPREGIYISLQRRDDGVLFLYMKVWISKESNHISPPNIHREGTHSELSDRENASVYFMRWIDEENVLAGITHDPTSPEYARAQKCINTWARSLTKALEPTLKHPEDLPWNPVAHATFQGGHTAGSLSQTTHIATRTCGVRNTRDLPIDVINAYETQRRHISKLRVVNTLGILWTVSSGATFAYILSRALNNDLSIWGIPQQGPISLTIFALFSMCIALRVHSLNNHTFTHQPLPLGPHITETILTLKSAVLSSKETRIDLKTPFTLDMYQSNLVHNTPTIAVHIAQHQARLTFRVHVPDSTWFNTLPTLNSYAPILDGHDFDTWLLPTLIGHHSVHTEEHPHIYAHTAAHPAQKSS